MFKSLNDELKPDRDDIVKEDVCVICYTAEPNRCVIL